MDFGIQAPGMARPANSERASQILALSEEVSPSALRLSSISKIAMNESIALASNVYNDAAALHGALETAQRFFDNLFFVHAGPNGAYSTDGTIELLEKYGATVVFDDINKGFGAIRTRCLHDCGCTFAAILDADERFYPELPVLHPEGQEKWSPGQPRPNLSVHVREGIVKQGELIRNLMTQPNIMAIRATRRHWFDFSMKHPSQNWIATERDHQLRIVRNIPEIEYRSNVKMHEKLVDLRTGCDPTRANQDDYFGPFIDHFHPFFREAYPGSKEFGEANYARLERGEPMLAK